MPLTDDFIDWIVDNMLGNAVTPFDNSNAAFGVGDDNTAFSSSQSQLQAEANATEALRQGMNSGYPARDPDSDGSSNKQRYRATFGTSQANFQWQEWGIFNDPTSGGGVMENREVEYLGEKTNNVVWVFEVDVTLSTA